MRAEIAIVGGGVMGTAVAMRAARRTDPLSEPVVLFERRELGAGSSGRSGAILRQMYADAEVAAMARDSLREYAAFQDRTGRSIGFARTGVLTIAGPAGSETAEHVAANVAMMRTIGIDVRSVDAEEMRRLCKGVEVSDDAVGAWEPGGGFVDAQRTVEQFGALARDHGAVTRVGVGVNELIVEDGRVVGLETDAGRCDAKQVVLVAGPWTHALLARAGLELPLRAVRPENTFCVMPFDPLTQGEQAVDGRGDQLAFTVDLAQPGDPLQRLEAQNTSDDARASAHPVLLDFELGFYTRCEPRKERTWVGPTVYDRDRVLDDPDALTDDVDAETVAWGRDVLTRRLPAYGEQPDAGTQVAWYTLTPDAQAVIGRVDGLENLIVATGFSGHGFKLAPSVAEGIEQLLFRRAGQRVRRGVLRADSVRARCGQLGPGSLRTVMGDGGTTARWDRGVSRRLALLLVGFGGAAFAADRVTAPGGVQLASTVKSDSARAALLAYASGDRPREDVLVIGDSRVRQGVSAERATARLSRALGRPAVFYKLATGGLRTTLVADMLDELVEERPPSELLIVSIGVRTFCRADTFGEWQEQRQRSARVAALDGLGALWKLPFLLDAEQREQNHRIAAQHGDFAGAVEFVARERPANADDARRRERAKRPTWVWKGPDSVEQRDWARALDVLERVRSDVLVISMPVSEGYHDEEMPGLRERFDDEIVAELERRGIEYLDLNAAGFPSDPSMFSDRHHLNRAGGGARHAAVGGRDRPAADPGSGVGNRSSREEGLLQISRKHL